MHNLNQEEWQQAIDSSSEAVVIDVRTPHEIAEGYIPGALHINIQDAVGFMQQVEQLDKSKDYFLYCRAGGRSAQACLIMESQGFSNTNNLIGGFDQWKGPRTE